MTALCIAVGAAVLAAALFAGFAVSMGRAYSTVSAPSLPQKPDRPTGSRVPVAVLLGSTGTVATDALGPYAVFARSPHFDVFTVSVDRAPVALSGGLTALPDYSVADLAAGRAPLPRIIVVPAMADPGGEDEAPLRQFIETVYAGGGTVLAVCAGANVLAATSVLEGKRATSFWSNIPGLRRSHPSIQWVDGLRYVQDGRVTTTGGVSSGIAGALRLVEQFASRDEAQRIGAEVGYPGWSIDGDPTIAVNHLSLNDYHYYLAVTLPWLQPRYGIGLTPGVDELDVSAAAELYSGSSFLVHAIPVAEQPVVTTAHGLTLLATPIAQAPDLDRLVVPGVDLTSLRAGDAPVYLPHAGSAAGSRSFEPILQDIASWHGGHTARTAAKYIEYPLPALPPSDAKPVRLLVLTASVLALAAIAGCAPLIARMLWRLRR
jgi:putative intracellular protease/amidase